MWAVCTGEWNGRPFHRLFRTKRAAERFAKRTPGGSVEWLAV
jgi:hypothetical protein